MPRLPRSPPSGPVSCGAGGGCESQGRPAEKRARGRGGARCALWAVCAAGALASLRRAWPAGASAADARAFFGRPGGGRAAAASSLEVWSFNLRTEFQEQTDGPNGWSKRRAGVAELIGRRRPALVCTQEATEPMVAFVASEASKAAEGGRYEYAATSRTPGEQDETAGFLFDARRLRLRSHEASWLVPPGGATGEPAWDAMCPRTFESAVFELLDGDGAAADGGGAPLCLHAINTHLDHVGVRAREFSARLLAEAVARGARELPHCAQLVCGDFNSPKGGGNAVYELLTAPPRRGGAGLSDVLRRAGTVRGAVPSTIHKFEGTDFEATMGDGTVDLGRGRAGAGEERAPDAQHIDWMLWRNATKGTRLRPLECEVVLDRLSDGRWPSDHFPIRAVFEVVAGGGRRLR